MSGYFDPTRPALVDSTRRARVNFEFYYFADDSGKQRFDADPLRWCGMVTDPVSHVRFRPTDDSEHTTVDGVPFFFASEHTRLQFAADPDSFSVIRAEMMEREHSMPPSRE